MGKTALTRLALGLAAVAVLAGGCLPAEGFAPSTSAAPPAQKTAGKTSFNRFPDMPVPTGAAIDPERTLILGGGEGWAGQVAVTSPHGPYDLFDFYSREMSGFGWETVALVRAPTSVLTFSRQDRVCTIQISSGTLKGSDVTITVTPREQAAAAPMPGGAAPIR